MWRDAEGGERSLGWPGLEGGQGGGVVLEGREARGAGATPTQLPPPPRSPDEAFEALRIEPFSSPPELPDVMKPQDSGSSANEQAVQ